MNPTLNHINLWMAWIGILLGLLSGALIGLFFHRDEWLGGYGSWRRRLLRLGHISFFGIAFLNLAFANTVSLMGAATPAFAAWSLVAGAVLMPAICFLAAWRPGFRHLFFLPVVTLISGAVGLLAGEVLP
ncbi:MAG: hypothetical protein NOF05_19115 [Candidatus Accumulibacter phosphatis]|uniref:DUF423 domain-containing protein n=3 Tax=Candidatus Accumulibacter TaxID=327159 RepID=A0A080M530_9PROT|nr:MULTISPECIES: hypothetical protein [Candidatus Accumulibacter]KFB75570.1 MAG: hypothetical protein AW06_003402 [Candidatus Accumulibacter cognatus]MCC2868291.1 hypothetical protein [Candidatus Accumulibacter phosphatis]MCM8578488.1 hypothetical protein [Accumulibacter sp.]MCM8620838.1 hypothetical protein [Accumulibacter sp.]MCQ1550864.1 hypothetical protein [Candidatus Accumulibacter phosphatis]